MRRMGQERGLAAMPGIAASVSRSNGAGARGPSATRGRPRSSGLSRMKT